MWLDENEIPVIHTLDNLKHNKKKILTINVSVVNLGK